VNCALVRLGCGRRLGRLMETACGTGDALHGFVRDDVAGGMLRHGWVAVNAGSGGVERSGRWEASGV